jgi:hypothetical protein
MTKHTETDETDPTTMLLFIMVTLLRENNVQGQGLIEQLAAPLSHIARTSRRISTRVAARRVST